MKTLRVLFAFALLLASACASAQTAPPALSQVQAFDVVSIHRSKPATYPGANGGASITGALQPDGYRAVNQTMFSTIMLAYFPQGAASWTHDRLKGEPAWLDTDQFDINAKVAVGDLPAWQAQGGSPAGQQMFRAMLQAMLADRCKLVLHQVPGEVPGLVLELARGGPLFKPTPADEVIPEGGMRLGDGTTLNEENGRTIKFYGVTMEKLCWYLSTFSYQNLTVRDGTGLTGRYDLVLQRPQPGPGDDDESGASHILILDAVGLKVRQIKVPLDTLVIEHIERPSEN